MQSNQSYSPPGSPAPTPPRRRRANRTVLTSAAAGLLTLAVIAAGTALASAGARQGHRAAPGTARHQRARQRLAGRPARPPSPGRTAR